MSFDEPDTTEAHEYRIKRCSSCQVQIIFLPTPAGKTMPVDALTVEPDDNMYDSSRHESHFRNCNDPNKHSRKTK